MSAVVRRTDGEIADLGIATMRLLASAGANSQGFSLAEFSGGEGPWTIPHVHNKTEEAFFILEGRFTFTVDGSDMEVGPGDYLLVPPGTPHVFRGRNGGGRLLVSWVPGGLEKMFLELSQLPPNAVRDPAVRAAVAARHDAVPVQ